MSDENAQEELNEDELFIELNIRRTAKHKMPLPTLGSEEAAGYDLRALDAAEIPVGGRALIKTGFSWEIPAGLSGFVCPRSGLALKHGVTVLNSPGVIDADYRGDVGVILINHGTEVFHVTPDMRIAQLVLMPAWNRVSFNEVFEKTESDRSEQGFGSTGTH